MLRIVELAAPSVWQEAAAAAHPDVPPVQLHSRPAFKQLVQQASAAAGGHLPPRSRLSVDQLECGAETPQGQEAAGGLAARMRAMLGLGQQ